MKLTPLLFSFVALAAAGDAVAKNSLACFEEPGTRKTFCIDESKVEQNGDVRSSPYFTGGPNGVRQTPYLMVTDCRKKFTTLQDKLGVNFAAGAASATPQSKALSQWICDVPKPKQNPKVRIL